MERGLIKIFDRTAGSGTISRGEEKDIQFYANAIISRDRNALNQGDPVWFEVESFSGQHFAINIRRCT